MRMSGHSPCARPYLPSPSEVSVSPRTVGHNTMSEATSDGTAVGTPSTDAAGVRTSPRSLPGDALMVRGRSVKSLSHQPRSIRGTGTSRNDIHPEKSGRSAESRWPATEGRTPEVDEARRNRTEKATGGCNSGGITVDHCCGRQGPRGTHNPAALGAVPGSATSIEGRQHVWFVLDAGTPDVAVEAGWVSYPTIGRRKRRRREGGSIPPLSTIAEYSRALRQQAWRGGRSPFAGTGLCSRHLRPGSSRWQSSCFVSGRSRVRFAHRASFDKLGGDARCVTGCVRCIGTGEIALAAQTHLSDGHASAPGGRDGDSGTTPRHEPSVRPTRSWFTAVAQTHLACAGKSASQGARPVPSTAARNPSLQVAA